MDKCLVCGQLNDGPHVCEATTDSVINSSKQPTYIKSSPIPLLQKGKAPDSISILQLQVLNIERQLLERREDSPLTLEQSMTAIARETGQLATLVSMTFRPTHQAPSPPIKRFSEELSDILLQCFNMANTLEIDLGSEFMDRLSIYEKLLHSGKFDNERS